jgi:hypothetical protein
MKKHIAAFTESNAQSYPGYVSVNGNETEVSITVRTRGALAASFINMNRDDLARLNADIDAYLKATALAPKPKAKG